MLVSRHLWKPVGDGRWRPPVSLPPDVAAETHCRSTAWTRRSVLRPRIQTLARKEEDVHIGAQAAVVRSSYHVWSDFVARNKTQQINNNVEYEQVKTKVYIYSTRNQLYKTSKKGSIYTYFIKRSYVNK